MSTQPQPLLVTPQQAEELRAAIRKINNLRGDGVSHGPDSITIASVQPRSRGTIGGSVRDGLFPVRVEKTSGFEGSRTSKCDFKYTVRNLTKTEVLATEVIVIRPRPFGKMIAQTGTSGVGVAFYYEGGTGVSLVLWDAGEIPETASCTAPT